MSGLNGSYIVFLGTRGYIEERSRLHRMHSAVLFAHRGKRLLLDAGETWRGRLRGLCPDWIAITHAHPDHSFALAEGTDVPVYVSRASYELLKKYPVKRFRIFHTGQTICLGPFKVKPYDVVHSIRAPAVGFRITVAHQTYAYNPDVLSIPNEREVLRGVHVYIGDGATLNRPIVRRRNGRPFGHTSVRTQLEWCKRNGIHRMYIVHCGKQLVEMAPTKLQVQINDLAAPTVTALVTHDGLRVPL